MTSPLARLDVSDRGRVLVARITGEVDMSNASELGRAVVGRLTGDSAVLLLDLSEVTYLDSAGIRVIYELRDQLASRGLELRLVVPPGAPTMTALRLTGVPDVVPIAASAAEAERDLG